MVDRFDLSGKRALITGGVAAWAVRWRRRLPSTAPT